MKKRWQRRHISEAIVKGFMRFSFGLVAGSLALILWTIISRGLPALSWGILPPKAPVSTEPTIKKRNIQLSNSLRSLHQKSRGL